MISILAALVFAFNFQACADVSSDFVAFWGFESRPPADGLLRRVIRGLMAECESDLSGFTPLLHGYPPSAFRANRESISSKTVYFERRTDEGDVILFKSDWLHWMSSYSHPDFLFTPQNDPRAPMFLFGSKLSRLLGFKYRRGHGGEILIAPSADKLGALIAQANQRLSVPIPYLPIHADYVSADDILRLATLPSDLFLMRFPYADDCSELVCHEVAFHLGAIVFPPFLFKRARMINLLTVSLIQFLRVNAREIGLVALKIADQLAKERAFENDAGTANLMAELANLRGRNKLIPYSSFANAADFRKQLARGSYEQSLDAIHLLARPGMSAKDAVLIRMNKMTGLDIKGLVESETPTFPMLTSDFHGFGTAFSLSVREMAALKSLVRIWAAKGPPSGSEPLLEADTRSGTDRDWFRLLLMGLDQRIKDIERALKLEMNGSAHD